MRKNGLENLVTMGKVNGRRARGRQRITFINNALSERKEVIG